MHLFFGSEEVLFYRNIAISFYRNIACQNRSSDEGLNAIKIYRIANLLKTAEKRDGTTENF
jgi:hypothetical protein